MCLFCNFSITVRRDYDFCSVSESKGLKNETPNSNISPGWKCPKPVTTLLQLPFFFWLQIAIRAKLGKVDRVQFFPKKQPPDWGCHSEPPQAGWARLTTFNLSQRKQPPYLTGVAIQSPLSLARDLASCWSAHSTASTPASCATTWKRPTLEALSLRLPRCGRDLADAGEASQLSHGSRLRY